MTKLFSDYLLEKNLLTPDQVLQATITQLRSTPATAEVIFDQKLLSSLDQLRILSEQQRSGEDFQTTARKLGIWNEQLMVNLRENTQKVQRPFGEVLIELGYLNIEGLTAAFDTYVESYLADNTVKLAPQSEAKKVLLTAGPAPNENQVQVNNAQKTSDSVSTKWQALVKQIQTIDPILSGEYINNFEGSVGPSLLSVTKNLERSGDVRSEIMTNLNKARSEMVSLRAAASFLNVPLLSQLTDSLVNDLNLMISTDQAISSSDALAHLGGAYHVFDALVQHIKVVQNDGAVDVESNQNLYDLLQRFEQTREKMQLKFIPKYKAVS